MADQLRRIRSASRRLMTSSIKAVSLFFGACCWFSTANPPRDSFTVLVTFHGDRVDIDACRRLVLVIERGLRFEQVARVFKDNSRVGVARLMDVDLADPGLRRILFQIVREGAG